MTALHLGTTKVQDLHSPNGSSCSLICAVVPGTGIEAVRPVKDPGF